MLRVPLRRACSTLVQATRAADAVHCTWSDGSAGRFHVTWLRDHCPSTIHPDSGQRTVELRHITQGIAPERVAVEEDGRTLALSWPTDTAADASSSSSTFDAAWLWRNCGDRAAQHRGSAGVATMATNTPWAPSDFQSRVRRTSSWAAVLQDDDAVLACLRELQSVGFCLIGDCPPSEGATERLATRIGRIQGTLYGDAIWDTAPRAEGEIMDTAYSNCELPLHTDCSYLKHQPGLQLFNCAEQADAPPERPLDGSTRLADGFKAAEVLRREHPATFDFFCRVALPFMHTEGDSSLEHVATVFELHPFTREVVSFRYNELDRAPLGPPLGFDDVRDYYHHQAILIRVLSRLEMPLRLSPGDAIFVDNHRVLHGRHGFTGRRNMIGCYLTADDWQSNLRVLERRVAEGIEAEELEEARGAATAMTG